MKGLIIVLVVLAVIGIAIYIGIQSVKQKIRQFSRQNLGTPDILKVISQATEEKRNTPKSLSGGDSMFLDDIYEDFPEFDIEVAKAAITECIKDVFTLTDSKIDEKYSSAIADFSKTIFRTYTDIKYPHVHNIVISKYVKASGNATIKFQCSYEFKSGGEKHQMRAEVSYSYSTDGSSEALRCPHCGGPIDNLGSKVCGYCGALIQYDMDNVWKIINIKDI